MHFIIHALDKSDAFPRRMAVIDAHRSYLSNTDEKFGVSMLLSGPLVQDDGEGMKGSFLLVEAKDREAVETMVLGDPLNAADVWENVSIAAVSIRQNYM